jgi:hypothetical protein
MSPGHGQRLARFLFAAGQAVHAGRARGRRRLSGKPMEMALSANIDRSCGLGDLAGNLAGQVCV